MTLLAEKPAPPALATALHPARPSLKLIALRTTLVIAGLAAWFFTQYLLGARHAPAGTLPIQSDALLSLLTPVHDYLAAHSAAQNALLIISSAFIDILGIFLLARSIFGTTIRPFLGLLLLFGLRQIFQSLCVLPLPDEMLWHHPGFPSLLVTYGVSNDLFFSGHTALAVFGAVELARFGGSGGVGLRCRLIPLGIAIALFEALAVLALRAHWTMDVYAGTVTALLIAVLANKLAPPVDRLLARI